MSVFSHPQSPRSSSFTFTAVEPRYGAYGWSVRLRRRALEFSTLRVRGGGEFSVTGSGRATVTTAPLYKPGKRLIAVVRDASGARRRQLVAGRSGRLVVGVNLGRSNRYQEYTPPARQAGTRSVTASIRIERPT
jgi:hypothetical protein